jgi:hypothetical protein
MEQVPPKRQLSPDYMGSKIRSPQYKNKNKVFLPLLHAVFPIGE